MQHHETSCVFELHSITIRLFNCLRRKQCLDKDSHTTMDTGCITFEQQRSACPCSLKRLSHQVSSENLPVDVALVAACNCKRTPYTGQSSRTTNVTQNAAISNDVSRCIRTWARLPALLNWHNRRIQQTGAFSPCAKYAIYTHILGDWLCLTGRFSVDSHCTSRFSLVHHP